VKRVLFDVGHPAQVHNFKHVYCELSRKGWEGFFTAKDKEVTVKLLEKYNLPYFVIGKYGKNVFSKGMQFFGNFIKFLNVLIKFKPEIIICRFSLHAVWGAKMLGIPVIGLADTEHTKFLDSITVPLADVKLTGNSYAKNLGKNHIRFDGNIELFYLHPNTYKIPERKIPDLNLLPDQEYVLLRFVAWSAHHDIGEKGIPFSEKTKLVKMLERKFKVFICSESTLPPDQIKYKINIPPDKMHDVLAHASLYIGEGASMASEAACLGVPAIYVNSLQVGYVLEEEKFNLVLSLRNSKDLIQKVQEQINDPDLNIKTKENRKRYLSDKIDPTALLVWFIENWPESLMIMKENPEYQKRFK